jgi:hypothetical protein
MAIKSVSKKYLRNPSEVQPQLSNRDANRLLMKMMKLPAELSMEEMDAIEQWWESERINRRLALIFLTKPFKWIRRKTETDRKFAVNMSSVYHVLGEQLENYKNVGELLERIQVRMMFAMACRKDMDNVLEEGKKSIVRREEANEPA